jgi:hypothetical protein
MMHSGANAVRRVWDTRRIINASNQRNKMKDSGFLRSHTEVLKTSRAYFPVCIAPAIIASIHSSVEILDLRAWGLGERDFFRCTFAGEGAEYCFLGEAETKTVFAAGLRLRD